MLRFAFTFIAISAVTTIGAAGCGSSVLDDGAGGGASAGNGTSIGAGATQSNGAGASQNNGGGGGQSNGASGESSTGGGGAGVCAAELICGVGECQVIVPASNGEGQPQPCVPPEAVQAETCDGIDNNCDGIVDEGCPCTDGTTQACYTGAPETRGVGSCSDGLQKCKNGVWGQCLGSILPVSETANGLDDDCDGVVDDGCTCTPGSTQRCYDGPSATEDVGPCRDGKQTCQANGTWAVACEAEVLPTQETCTGQDDLCNGIIDDGCNCEEGATQPCYDGPANTGGVGTCRTGTQTCHANTWGLCIGEVIPVPEICNGLDDDCNGVIDNPPPGGDLCSMGKTCEQGSCQ